MPLETHRRPNSTVVVLRLTPEAASRKYFFLYPPLGSEQLFSYPTDNRPIFSATGLVNAFLWLPPISSSISTYWRCPLCQERPERKPILSSGTARQSRKLFLTHRLSIFFSWMHTLPMWKGSLPRHFSIWFLQVCFQTLLKAGSMLIGL